MTVGRGVTEQEYFECHAIQQPPLFLSINSLAIEQLLAGGDTATFLNLALKLLPFPFAGIG